MANPNKCVALKNIRIIIIDNLCNSKINVLNNLYKIGYSKIVKKNDKKHKINLIKNFQRKFRQNLINGRIDRECLLIIKNLFKL